MHRHRTGIASAPAPAPHLHCTGRSTAGTSAPHQCRGSPARHGDTPHGTARLGSVAPQHGTDRPRALGCSRGSPAPSVRPGREMPQGPERSPRPRLLPQPGAGSWSPPDLPLHPHSSSCSPAPQPHRTQCASAARGAEHATGTKRRHRHRVSPAPFLREFRSTWALKIAPLGRWAGLRPAAAVFPLFAPKILLGGCERLPWHCRQGEGGHAVPLGVRVAPRRAQTSLSVLQGSSPLCAVATAGTQAGQWGHPPGHLAACGVAVTGGAGTHHPGGPGIWHGGPTCPGTRAPMGALQCPAQGLFQPPPWQWHLPPALQLPSAPREQGWPSAVARARAGSSEGSSVGWGWWPQKPPGCLAGNPSHIREHRARSSARRAHLPLPARLCHLFLV